MKAIHGGLDHTELRELGLMPDEVIDFSANINPLGTSRRVRRAAAAGDLSAYPDSQCLVFREALAERLRVRAEQLLVGNGSTELIHLIARARLRDGKKCLIFEPTFGEYEAAARLTGATVERITAQASEGFSWSIDSAVQAIKRCRPEVVFLCNPNNPTGLYLDQEKVERIWGAIRPDGLLVLDEAYVPLTDGTWDSVRFLQADNVAILRSMTKDHALAGVRLGYLLMHPDSIEDIGRFQHPWSVNAVALATGQAALDDEEHIEAARKVVRSSKVYLSEQLARMGLLVTPSAANFLIVRIGDARRVRIELLHRGFAVRDCTSFGLPEYIRIGIRGQKECELLVSALRQVIQQ